MTGDNMGLLRNSLASPIVDIERCGVSPTLDQLALYCEARPDENLVDALKSFLANAAGPQTLTLVTP